MITITIDGKEIQSSKDITVLEAARSAGIKIPTLCYHEQLEKYGGCRLCLVEVEKMPKLQTACTLMAVDGMVVRTETEEIAEMRRSILEFFLINHPLDCPFCDKAGECDLQNLVEQYGPAKGRYKERKRKCPESLDDPVIVRNMERCILCTRCVRMCEQVQGASALAVIERGGNSRVEPFSGSVFECEYCGNCVSVCPVGAIMSRLHRHSYRPWQIMSETETICPYCGVGCSLVVQMRDDSIKRVVSRVGRGVNNGLLCAKGSFGYEFVGSKERLTKPLIKKNGEFEEATWEDAINLVVKKFSEIKDEYGSSSVSGIASPRCTNEDNYVFQKFMRTVLGTNNVDSSARTGYAGTQKFVENIFGQGSTANVISGLANSDLILVIGGDPTTVNPVLGLRVRECSRKEGSVLTIGHVEGLKNFTSLSLNPTLYTEDVLLEGIVTELKNKKGLRGSRTALEILMRDVNISAEEVEKRCGIPGKDLSAFVDMLSDAVNPSLVLGHEIIQSSAGSYKLSLISAIYYLTNARMYLLSERPNEQGLLDMGCAPDLLPGYRPLASAELRRRYENAWKITISDEPGFTIFEMIDAAHSGMMKALYIMGENLVFNLPRSGSVEEALEKIDFLVVQDIFLTETARCADVVLPSLSWSEKEGTFTNIERRIQLLRKAVHRDGMEDWKIISEISKKMGTEFNYASAEDVFAEICEVSPLHRNLTYEEISRGKAVWPYKGEPLRGLSEIHMRKMSGMKADAELYVKLERPLFHSGTLSRKALALSNLYPHAVARISPYTAESFSLRTDNIVRVSTKTGFLELPVVIDKSVDRSTVLLTNNFEGKGAFRIIDYTIDPVTQAPCLDGNEVTLEKVSRLDSEVRR